IIGAKKRHVSLRHLSGRHTPPVAESPCAVPVPKMREAMCSTPTPPPTPFVKRGPCDAQSPSATSSRLITHHSFATLAPSTTSNEPKPPQRGSYRTAPAPR